MNPFEHYRKEIDAIDGQLIDLLQKRMAIAEEIGRIKEEQGIETRDPKREKAIIERLSKTIESDAYRERIIMIFRTVLEASRALQNSGRKIYERSGIPTDEKLKLGYTGLPGSFAETALYQYFGDREDPPLNYPTFSDACDAILNEEINYGVLPVENTTTGAINEVYDLIREKDLYIIGEVCVPIVHCLIGLDSAHLDNIREIYSHPQGLEQCSQYLERFPNAQLIPLKNTALSVKHIADKKDPYSVAIAGERTAELYGMKVLDSAIQNCTMNTTRFTILSKRPEKLESADSFSIVFTAKHEAGSLHHILECFAKENVNLFRIESRPILNRPWEYYIYLDAEGTLNDPEVLRALENAENQCPYFRFLGSYRRGINC